MGYLLQNGGLGMAGDWIITGGRPLQGRVEVPAAKNSVLPLLAASLLCSGPVRRWRLRRWLPGAAAALAGWSLSGADMQTLTGFWRGWAHRFGRKYPPGVGL